MKKIYKILAIFFAVDFGIVLFTILQQNYIWFLNTQIAFFSSFLVTLATFLSYKKSIQNQVENLKNSEEFKDKDVIDKVEDRFDLYDDDENSKKEPESERELYKEEKEKLKKSMFKNLKYSSSFLSPFRVVGYGLLVGGFFYLNKNGQFDIYSYFFGLSIVPIVAIFASIFVKDE